MGLLDMIKKGKMKFGDRYSNLFLNRLGRVQNYTDRNRTYIDRGYQENPIVYSVTNIVSKNGSKANWVCKDKNTGEVIENNLLKAVMESPTPDKSWMDFIQELLTHKILTGNAFAAWEYGSGINEGKPSSLFTMPSEEIQIIIGNDQRSIAGYQLDFAWADTNIIPATDVLHIKSPNPDYDEEGDWLYGQSPFRAARRSIQTYNESLETGVWFLENKGSQKILVNRNDEIETSPEAMEQFKDRLRNQAQGSKNAGNIAILDGDLGVLDISANASDALVLEQRIQAAKEICNVINFPIQLIGIESSTYQNAKEAKKALWENVIIPELHEIKAGLNRWLAPKFGKNIYLDFDVSDIDALQEDKLMAGKAIKEYAGMITVNEARQMAGLQPIDSFADGGTGEDRYVGFTQAVVSDQEEISEVNGTNEENDE